MKCCVCSSKKGKRLCQRYNSLICSSCCGKQRNIKYCNSLCEYMSEKYDLLPMRSIELTELGRGKVFLFSESLFLPNILECLWIKINKFKINIKSPTFVSISLEFVVNSKIERTIREEELYIQDSWKREDNTLFPFLQIYTDGEGKIINQSLKISNHDETIVIENNHLDTWMPFSKCIYEKIDNVHPDDLGLVNKGDIIQVGDGKYFFGKNSTLLSRLKLNEKYFLVFDIQYDNIKFCDKKLILPFGVFFPFSFVYFDEYVINTIKDCILDIKSPVKLILPNDDKFYFISALPLENNDSICYKFYYPSQLSNMMNNFFYDRYTVLYNVFSLSLQKEANTSIIFNDIPIFTGIYDNFNKVFKNEYAPISILIINNASIIQDYKIVVEIMGLSYRYCDEISVEPYKIDKINISPNLKNDEISVIHSVIEKDISVKILCGREVICEKTGRCTVYPKEYFIEYLDNSRHDWKLSFLSFISRWITPNDPAIDNIIATAALNNDIVGGTSSNFYRIQSDMEKIFNTLSDMHYAVRSTTFSDMDKHTQRISLPKNTIKLKSGNCIDLSILLASCYEAMKLNTYIVLVPGHAFLGVKINESYIEYIESTCLGKNTYTEAIRIGREKYEMYFKNNSSPNSNNVHIIDVANARKSKIFPMN